MIVRVPDYFSEFSCIAGDCKDSCCLGWEIDIDDVYFDGQRLAPSTIPTSGDVDTSKISALIDTVRVIFDVTPLPVNLFSFPGKLCY